MSPRATILIVDGDSLTRWSLVQALRGCYSAHAVGDQQEALYEIRTAAFDLLVIGCGSGELRCDELTRYARDRCPNLPVIVLGHLPAHETTCGCTLDTVQAYHEKPFDVAKLVQDIDRALTPGPNVPPKHSD